MLVNFINILVFEWRVILLRKIVKIATIIENITNLVGEMN